MKHRYARMLGVMLAGVIMGAGSLALIGVFGG